MANDKPAWQLEAEKILANKFDNDFSKTLATADQLVQVALTIEPPSGNKGGIIAAILEAASKDLPPLAATYVGFQVGVAHERFKIDEK